MAQQTIPPDALIELSVWQTYDTSRLLNIYHYQRPTGGATIINGDDFLVAAANALWSSVYGLTDSVRFYTSTRLRYDYIRAQVVSPSRQYYMPLVLGFNGLAGTSTIEGLPSDTQLCVTYRANRVGRGVNGRKAFAGLLLGDLSGSVWKTQTVTNWNTNVCPKLTADLTVLAEPLTPKIWNPRIPGQITGIAVCITQEEVRVQRRRQFRLGI